MQTVRNLLAHWAKVYLALEPYFDAQQCDDLRQQAAVLHRRLGESRDKFAAEFNQHTALVRIQKTACDPEERTQQYGVSTLWQSCKRRVTVPALPNCSHT